MSGKAPFRLAIFGYRKEIRFALGKALRVLKYIMIFLGEHLPLLLPRLNSHDQALLRVFVFLLNIVTVISLYLLLQLGSSRVVVIQRNADPRELYPDPSLVVIKRWLYLL